MKWSMVALLVATLSLGAAAARPAARKPLTKVAVEGLLHGDVPSARVAQLVKQHGISFEPAGAVIEELRKAGAGDGLIEALKSAWHPKPEKPLSAPEVSELLAERVPGATLAKLVERRGISFVPTEDYLQGLRAKGATPAVRASLRAATPKPLTRDDLLQSLATGEDPGQIAGQIRQRGISFEPTEGNLTTLRIAGASDALLQTIRTATRITVQTAQAQPSSPLAPQSKLSARHAAAQTSEVRVPPPPEPQSEPTRAPAVSPQDGPQAATNSPGSSAPASDVDAGNINPPVSIYKINPGYTPEAHAHKIQGVVEMSVVVDAKGNVGDAKEVSKQLGYGLDELALQTVKTWKFKPATREGVPVPVRVNVKMEFKLF
jgi:TonB family protein